MRNYKDAILEITECGYLQKKLLLDLDKGGDVDSGIIITEKLLGMKDRKPIKHMGDLDPAIPEDRLDAESYMAFYNVCDYRNILEALKIYKDEKRIYNMILDELEDAVDAWGDEMLKRDYSQSITLYVTREVQMAMDIVMKKMQIPIEELLFNGVVEIRKQTDIDGPFYIELYPEDVQERNETIPYTIRTTGDEMDEIQDLANNHYMNRNVLSQIAILMGSGENKIDDIF